MKTTTDLPLTKRIADERLQALRDGNRDFLKHWIEHEAALAASDVADKARKLIRDLQDAVTKLEAAESIKDAALAVSWLRSDTWPAMQRSMDRIGTLREALDAAGNQ
ncbi:MAG: hypothetical protein ACKVS9_16365 [Phycisphaerae bacterium]